MGYKTKKHAATHSPLYPRLRKKRQGVEKNRETGGSIDFCFIVSENLFFLVKSDAELLI